MTELTERARKLASDVEAIGLPNPDSSLRGCAEMLRALCDENDQLRDALGELLRAQFDADRLLDKARGRARSALDAENFAEAHGEWARA